MPGNTAYCLSKGGMRMLTRTAGVELAPHNILVVGVGPGRGGNADQSLDDEGPGQAREARRGDPAGAHGAARRRSPAWSRSSPATARATSPRRRSSPTAASCRAARVSSRCSPSSSGCSRREARTAPLEALGAVPLRAPVGHGARGLQPGRHRLGLLPARPRALARLPLGRGRPRAASRDHHQRALLRAGALERARPDPEGAALRPDRAAGQPRRGRQGVLLLPRLHADALLHEVPLQVPAARRSRTQRLVEENRAARPRASPSSSSLDTGVFDEDRYFDVFVEYAKAGARRHPGPRSRVANRGPEAAPLHLLPTLWFRNTWSWDVGRAPAAPARRRAPPARAAIARRAPERSAAAGSYARGRARAALHRERDERSSGSSAPPNGARYVEGRHQRLRRRRAAGRGEPGARRARRPPPTTG